MKVKISQRYVYNKAETIEIEIDINKDRYLDWIKENNYNVDDLDYYLSMNEYLWEEQIDEAKSSSEIDFGFGCYRGFNEFGRETETRYD